MISCILVGGQKHFEGTHNHFRWDQFVSDDGGSMLLWKLAPTYRIRIRNFTTANSSNTIASTTTITKILHSVGYIINVSSCDLPAAWPSFASCKRRCPYVRKQKVKHGLRSLFLPNNFSNTASISVSSAHSYIPPCLCYQSFRRSYLLRPGLIEIFCKRDYFNNCHCISTFLLITLFSSFCPFIFKSTSFFVLEYLHCLCRSGPTCWRNHQWLECQFANSKEMTNIGNLIFKWMLQSERHFT